MDKSATDQLLQFIGSGRPPVSKIEWDLPHLEYARLSFAMSGEDVALRHHFKRRIHAGIGGTFVDIGASHPSLISNTYLFYMLGWRGLAFDPNKHAAKFWGIARPHDTFIHAAVGDEEATAYWFRHEQPGMSIVSPSSKKPDGPFEDAVPVDVVRLDRTFEQHLGEKTIQLMSLDVEGAEMSVLRSNDWTRWRPEVIVMEVHGFDMMRPLESPTVAYLIDRGYSLSACVGANVFMIQG